MFMKGILKAITLILFVAAVAFAAGCAQKATTPGNENISPANGTMTPSNQIVTSSNGTVPPANVTTESGQVVTGNDSGKTISLQNGENFTLILRENPSTGFHWDLNVSKGLSILSSNYTQDPAPSGMAGVPGNRTWVIQGTAPGIQLVKGMYIPPGGNITGTENNFTLAVEVI
jgi:inhibitor of cysteine peptidase